MTRHLTRIALPSDAPATAHIYDQGVEDRVATFETEPRSAERTHAWFRDDRPIVVVEDEEGALAFAATFTYRDRACYRGDTEFSVYVAREQRGAGYGKQAMMALTVKASRVGYWKLESRVFPGNTARLKLLASLGFLKSARMSVTLSLMMYGATSSLSRSSSRSR